MYSHTHVQLYTYSNSILAITHTHNYDLLNVFDDLCAHARTNKKEEKEKERMKKKERT